MDNFRFVYEDENIACVGEIKNSRLILYQDLKNQIEGNIYRARVDSYINSMDAYVLNIGEFKNAILKRRNIVSDFKVGEDIIVEVLFVPNDDKLIEATQYISISDGYIVLLPFVKSNSPKIKNDLTLPYTLRTKAKDLPKKEILFRYNNLLNDFSHLQKEINKLPTPKLLRKGKFLTNFCLDYDGEIISNYKLKFASIIDAKFNPKYDREISTSIAKIDDRKIEIDKTSIYIDQLEALTVVDVNSGSKFMDRSKEDMSLSTNLSVIEEIVIQISLRNIKKMVLIDFIRVNNRNKEKIIDKLKQKFEEYNIKAKILGFSRLELLEIIVF